MPGLARVVVVGATGSGKSTFAQRLAVRLGAEYVEVDELFWDAHWTEAAPEVFRARVERATAGPRWVVAGNYGRVRDLLWPRADTIVWLDYAFPLVLRRLTVRNGAPGRHRRGPLERQPRVRPGALPTLVAEVAVPLALQDLLGLPA
jgi:energy-coupling factor transporter ATP-binding protein EcfA2